MKLLCGLLCLYCSYIHAYSWQDLWLNPDQQAAQLMQRGDYKQAQQLFQEPQWQASAAYRAENYQQAVQQFKTVKSEQGYYNLANSLAKLGKYQQALDAYDKSLAINPHDKDAIFNRKLIADLLKKQQQKQQQDSQKQQNQPNQQKDKSNQQQPSQQSSSSSNDQDKETEKPENKKENSSLEKSEHDKKEQREKQQEAQKKQDNEQQTPAQKKAQQEAQQAKEQWLRLIPDNPGGLLREKFLRDHIRRQKGWYQ